MKVLEFNRVDAYLELEIDGKEINDVSEIPLIDAIALDKIKQERERQYNKGIQALHGEKYLYTAKILDKLIAESEEH